MSLRELANLVVTRVPSWAPIGLREEQQPIDVLLKSAGGTLVIDDNHVIASLMPLTIAVGHAGIHEGELQFIDRGSGRALGALRLRGARGPAEDETGCSFLEVAGGEHWCLPPGLRAWQRLLQAKWRHDGGFRMSNSAVQHLMLFYLRPRPVVLVSVDDGVNNNLFPMDLVGNLRGHFTLALRSSSPSIATLRGSRRAALSDVALSLQPTVYELGKHHRLARIDWSSLPFPAERSPEFGLRVPAGTQRLRECAIEDWRELGSHTFFRCRVVSDTRLGDEPRLHHTCGIHRAFRQRSGHFPWQEYARA